MLRVITHASDRVLEAVLGSADAGACVPSNGQFCYCVNNRYYAQNCYGACTYYHACH